MLLHMTSISPLIIMVHMIHRITLAFITMIIMVYAGECPGVDKIDYYSVDAGVIMFTPFNGGNLKYEMFTKSGHVFEMIHVPVVNPGNHPKPYVKDVMKMSSLEEWKKSLKCHEQESNTDQSGFHTGAAYYDKSSKRAELIMFKSNFTSRLRLAIALEGNEMWCTTGGVATSIRSKTHSIVEWGSNSTITFEDAKVVGSLTTKVDTHPDAMINMRDINAKDELILIFFGPFHMTVWLEELKSMKFLNNMKEYWRENARFSNQFVGCPEEFCFDFNVDAAYTRDDEIHFMSGMFEYVSSTQWPPEKQPKIMSEPSIRRVGSASAAFFMNDRLHVILREYLLKDQFNYEYTNNYFYMVKPGESGIGVVIMRDVTQNINAAFVIDDEFFIVFDDHLRIYKYKKDGMKYTKTRIRSYSDVGLPPYVLIDAAFSLEERVILISGVNYYSMDKNNRTVVGPHVIMTEKFLSSCPNDYYQKSYFKEFLDIKSKSDFITYMKNKTINTIPDQNTNENPKRKKKKLIKGMKIGLIVLSIAALALLIGIIVMLCTPKRGKSSEEMVKAFKIPSNRRSKSRSILSNVA